MTSPVPHPMNANLSRLLYFLFLAVLLPTGEGEAADRPNVVWIVSEDNSIHYLRHFFPGGAEAPHIEALAARGLSFRHAFSNAPVCSVARTTLATMCYGPRIGTQFHRRYRIASLPGTLRMFPAYLREAGYHTTNNAKKDYNAGEDPGTWDESSARASWRDRPDPSRPFFHMHSHAQSHESSLHFNRAVFGNEPTVHDPAAVPLAPCFPDTPLFRYTHARYLDRMQVIDGIVGDTVAKLEADGLLEDTFVFYFGDHGGVLPRSKGYLFETGLHVPLVVRVPENFRHLVPAPDGTWIDGFVSFIDFGATVLRLAGVELPEGIDGRPFLGEGIRLEELNARNEAFGHADRFDEKYEMVRSLRQGRYHYVRSYQPYLPDGLQNNYRYKQLAYEEWRSLFTAGKLEGPPAAFFAAKPAERLFDVEADPHEIVNLAADPAHAPVLESLRARLGEMVRGMPDLSFYPESHLVAHAFGDASGFGQARREEIATLAETADLALLPYATAEPKLRSALRSENAWERYWAATACATFGEAASGLAGDAEALLADEEPSVRLRAIEFLGRIGRVDPQPRLGELVNATTDPVFATEALNAVVWFRDFFGGSYPVDRSAFHPPATGGDVMDRLNYLNGDPYPDTPAKKRAP